MTKLRNIGASILWFLGLAILVAQTYRAVAYYIFDVAFDLTLNDLYLSITAFVAMFINAELKKIIIEIFKGLTSKFRK